MTNPCQGHAAESARAEHMKEAERLMRQYTTAVLEQNYEAIALYHFTLLAHIQRGAVPEGRQVVPMPEPVGWYVSGPDPEHAALWRECPDDEQMQVMNQQCDDGPVVARPLVLGADAKRYGDDREAAGYARGLAEADKLRGLLLWALYHHQGGSSNVGQPIRRALGIGQHDRLSDEQIECAKRATRSGEVKP